MKITSHKIHDNLSVDVLQALALKNKEGVLAANGALNTETGKRTGRSVNDRFIVKDATTENKVDWGVVNVPTSTERFNALWELATEHMKSHEQFVSHYAVGSDEHYQIPVTVITELAWHQLFCHQLFIRQPAQKTQNKQWTMLSAATLKTDPARDGVNSEATLMIDFTQRRILACGLLYAGEMKKAMFSVMNYLMPAEGVLPMHCAANAKENGDDTVIFFGLSGTGKTTLSADPARYLIGDDEHGWGKNGVFNFEGGCYAKCINLSAKNEPVIWHAIREGAIMENVVLDKNTLEPDYANDSLSENTRAAYPLEFIEKRVLANRGGQPSAVIFLTCDLYGVLPPVAKLTPEQAAYYFLSGYTAQVGSTEVGKGTGVKPTFSTCFGAPFFPLPAHVYAELLIKRLQEDPCPVYLVNTGWTGGAYGEGGQRFSIPVTRAVVTAILNQELQKAEYEMLPGFNFMIPKAVAGIDTKILNPKLSWADQHSYAEYSKKLISAFVENFEKKFKNSAELAKVGP
jgi:phosphoenolpyruvate carboxykinase (ATP)